MERPISGAIMHDNAVVTYVCTDTSFLQMDSNILKRALKAAKRDMILEHIATVGTHFIRKD